MSAGDWKVCSNSGDVQMLSWMPDDDYVGAVVCLSCSGGILIVKGSAHKATSVAGFEGMAGKVRKHYVNTKTDTISMRKPRKEQS